jgi:hypothetical protein
MIVVTERSTPAEVIASIRAHAFSHLNEPLDRENLAQVIDQALEEPTWDDGIEVLSARPEWISLRLKCKKVTAERLLQFLQELRTDLSEAERTDIGTALREMLLNAIEHGGHFNPENSVDITRIRTPGMVLYLIRDPGEGFSFDSLLQAAVSNPVSNSESRNYLSLVSIGGSDVVGGSMEIEQMSQLQCLPQSPERILDSARKALWIWIRIRPLCTAQDWFHCRALCVSPVRARAAPRVPRQAENDSCQASFAADAYRINKSAPRIFADADAAIVWRIRSAA